MSLVLVRHGQTEKHLSFTGWSDPPLAFLGQQTSRAAAALIEEHHPDFDVAFTSVLMRAVQSLDIILGATDNVHLPVVKDWRLNEKMCGAMTGQSKHACLLAFGQEDFQAYRRSWATRPPPLARDHPLHPANDPHLASLPYIPDTESLADVAARVMPVLADSILPRVAAGARVLVVSHSNALRAVVKILDRLTDEAAAGVNIPYGIPRVYRLNARPTPPPTVPTDHLTMLAKAACGDLKSPADAAPVAGVVASSLPPSVALSIPSGAEEDAYLALLRQAAEGATSSKGKGDAAASNGVNPKVWHVTVEELSALAAAREASCRKLSGRLTEGAYLGEQEVVERAIEEVVEQPFELPEEAVEPQPLPAPSRFAVMGPQTEVTTVQRATESELDTPPAPGCSEGIFNARRVDSQAQSVTGTAWGSARGLNSPVSRAPGASADMNRRSSASVMEFYHSGVENQTQLTTAVCPDGIGPPPTLLGGALSWTGDAPAAVTARFSTIVAAATGETGVGSGGLLMDEMGGVSRVAPAPATPQVTEGAWRAIHSVVVLDRESGAAAAATAGRSAPKDAAEAAKTPSLAARRPPIAVPPAASAAAPAAARNATPSAPSSVRNWYGTSASSRMSNKQETRGKAVSTNSLLSSVGRKAPLSDALKSAKPSTPCAMGAKSSGQSFSCFPATSGAAAEAGSTATPSRSLLATTSSAFDGTSLGGFGNFGTSTAGTFGGFPAASGTALGGTATAGTFGGFPAASGTALGGTATAGTFGGFPAASGTALGGTATAGTFGGFPAASGTALGGTATAGTFGGFPAASGTALGGTPTTGTLGNFGTQRFNNAGAFNGLGNSGWPSTSTTGTVAGNQASVGFGGWNGF